MAAALEYLIVLAEGLIALEVTALAWRRRRSGPLFLHGVLLGIAWSAFVHGVCFGVIRIEGSRAVRDPGALAGFGLTLAFYLGIPLGAILGSVLVIVRKFSGPRPDRPPKG